MWKEKYLSGLILAVSLCASTALSVSRASGADFDEQFGQADITSAPEYGQWMFMRGEWDVTILVLQDDGSITELPQKPRVRAYYLEDGQIFQSEVSMGGGTVFFSTQIKAYSHDKKKWINNFVNSMRQRWQTTESQWQDGQMVSLVPGGYGGDEPFIAKEVLTEIEPDRILLKLYRSHDDGKSWEEQKMSMIYERALP